MRIETLIVRGHGLDVELDVAPLTIILGENDSGKSTLLEAARQALEGPHGDLSRPALGDRYHELEERRIGLVVELDGLGLAGHPDERFFCQLLQ
jgi:DNA repair exonuclease SbcCD ATPase subunit